MERKICTVSQVNSYIKNLMGEDAFLGAICVSGELSNYKIYPSGHHYFTLKDAASSIRCVMFRSSASRIRFRPEDGMKVIAVGGISVYERDGNYQLYCSDLIPEGAGDLHVAFEQLKKKLDAEGLFSPACKKPLPKYPHTIAIITSSAGAALHDMLRILRKRYPLTEVKLLAVRVQGSEAPLEICGAIRYANLHKLADLIITGRGGGSIEDLWAFNDERVAREIFKSEIPVISAVGHEPDVTISDYVADLRAATPSNAAELAVPDQEELRELLRHYSSSMENSIRSKLKMYRQKIDNYASKRVLISPENYLLDRRQTLDYLRSSLCAAANAGISVKKQRFASLASALDAMSPLKVLSRGYGMAKTESGDVLTSARQIKKGDRFVLTLTDGQIHAIAEKTEE